MKTVTVTAEQPELRKLVEEAHNGADVVLAYGDKGEIGTLLAHAA